MAPERDESSDLERLVASIAKVRGAWDPEFSPDGRRISVVSDLSGLPQVWTVPTEGGWPDLVTPLDDPISHAHWFRGPDGSTWLAFQAAPGGGMNSQVYVTRPDGTSLRRLTAGGRENNWLGRPTPDGRLMISSNKRDPAAMDVYLLDPANGALRLVATNQGIGRLTDVSRDGSRAILFREQQRSDSDLFLLDLEGGHEVLLTPHEGPGLFGNARFTPDGRVIYLASNGGRETIAFARVRLDADGRPGPIEVLRAREDAELQEFEVSPDGREAALVWNAGGRSELAFVDLDTLEETPGPALPGELVGQLAYAPDGRLLALAVSGGAASWDVWVAERPGPGIRRLTHSPHPGVDLGALVRPELVHFIAHDGLGLSGWLYLPRGFARPGPVVINFHGGPEAQERPRFSAAYQGLLAEGIAVFAPNVRGSAGFGKTFVNLDNGPLRVNAVRDIRSCVDHLVGAGVADPRRIGVMGGSYGGFMVMSALTEYPDRFAAGVNLFGVVNFETFFEHTEPWMAAISKVEYGDPETERDLLRALSPIHRVARVRAPLLVIHGANDTNVPVVEAEQVVTALRERGVPVEYILFPDEGHGIQRLPNRIWATVAIVRWFVDHLGGR